MNIVTAIAPAITCGLAVQQALEFMDSFVSAPFYGRHKKKVLKLIACLAGAYIAGCSGVRVLSELNVKAETWMDVVVTALVIGASGEGSNSVLKFLTYSKQQKKAVAAQSTLSTGDLNMQRMDAK